MATRTVASCSRSANFAIGLSDNVTSSMLACMRQRRVPLATPIGSSELHRADDPKFSSNPAALRHDGPKLRLPRLPMHVEARSSRVEP